MRGKISSNLEDLNILSLTYDWIPNENTIRPTAEDLERKRRVMDYVSAEQLSVRSYIINNIFGRLSTGKWVFKPSSFRYNLPAHSNHYVLWSRDNSYLESIDDDSVNRQLEVLIKNIVGHEGYMFAWYKNPRPTVIDFWHVQVFWIRT